MISPPVPSRYTYSKNGNQGFVECQPGMLIAGEDDVLDLISFCGENETDRLLIYAENFTEDFFDLHSGLAGKILLKLSTYRIILAAVISREKIGNGRFYEMVLETNRGHEFRVFENRSDAINWFSNL